LVQLIFCAMVLIAVFVITDTLLTHGAWR
jgi:hypothetical protein